MAPELKQSLKILSLPLTDLKYLIDEELVNNPFLEERPEAPSSAASAGISVRSERIPKNTVATDENFDPFAGLTKMPSLQDALSRQLEISIISDEEIGIGQQIIGNLNDDGYLTATVEEIAAACGAPLAIVEKTLKVIQKFEPLGVAARNIQECLIIQCDAMNIDDPLLRKIIEGHLDHVGKRKYELIAKELGASLNDVEACIKKITALDPRPGQNYAVERPHDIIPDIIIEEKDGELDIFINKEYFPSLYINEEYRAVLKKNNITPEAKEFLTTRLQEALELLRSIARRQSMLSNVIEAIVGIQKDALINGLSLLKPLTFQEVADKLEVHESTVCRAVMNKYADTPQGIIALKSLFTSSITQENGEEVSSTLCKNKIRELIECEDKKHPLSDEGLTELLLKENSVKIARRTVAKYREELKLLPSSLRRAR